MMRLPVTILLLLSSLVLCAQTHKVSATHTYYTAPSMSVKQGFKEAIEAAKVEALRKEFGTIVGSDFIDIEKRNNNQESSYISQLSLTEVKGEWIEDTKEPETRIVATMNDGTIVIEASVWGKARAISNEVSEFNAMTLRNGTEKRFADNTFYEGDDLFLYFKAPVDGYVAVYLIDDNQIAYCLLPYTGDSDGQQPVEHGKEYVFFSNNHVYDLASNKIDALNITCNEGQTEFNQLYVIFSPNPFTKAVDSDIQNVANVILPRQLSYQEFMKWKGKLASRDKKMGQKMIRMIVHKR